MLRPFLSEYQTLTNTNLPLQPTRMIKFFTQGLEMQNSLIATSWIVNKNIAAAVKKQCHEALSSQEDSVTVQVGILTVDGIRQLHLARMIYSLGTIRAKTNDVNYINSSKHWFPIEHLWQYSRVLLNYNCWGWKFSPATRSCNCAACVELDQTG